MYADVKKVRPFLAVSFCSQQQQQQQQGNNFRTRIHGRSVPFTSTVHVK